jgi:hypothetical protein
MGRTLLLFAAFHRMNKGYDWCHVSLLASLCDVPQTPAVPDTVPHSVPLFQACLDACKLLAENVPLLSASNDAWQYPGCYLTSQLQHEPEILPPVPFLGWLEDSGMVWAMASNQLVL